ncbi:hypothetical protein [Marivita sp. GX14005]|uniref:hypothetical protein n=1 Tax=Marivita sp. GX14005 TaxID=2942276 RepID=UPI00201990E6|nr:hypothetical protein [Marivita sp. GX14005]MCL3882008.1 hypothetical protein [Marivita sp. GX14005]
MTTMTRKLLSATAALALFAVPASAQMFGDAYGTDLDYNNFEAGFNETGRYEALDRNDDTFLDRSEYSTGLYADYDRDNDRMISEEEWDMGNERYLGSNYNAVYSDYDLDEGGFLDQEEFGGFYESEYTPYYDGLDTDGDEMLSQSEYNRGVYDAADLDSDEVISIEEEGWFEGWFDGDDIEAEIEEVGDVY